MNDLERALLAVAEDTAEPVGPPIYADVPENAKISVEGNTGHMLDGAVIAWTYTE